MKLKDLIKGLPDIIAKKSFKEIGEIELELDMPKLERIMRECAVDESNGLDTYLVSEGTLTLAIAEKLPIKVKK